MTRAEELAAELMMQHLRKDGPIRMELFRDALRLKDLPQQERMLALLERHGFLTGTECYYLGFGSNPRACISRLRDKGYRITTQHSGSLPGSSKGQAHGQGEKPKLTLV
jgi:Helix-turn-helix domain